MSLRRPFSLIVVLALCAGALAFWSPSAEASPQLCRQLETRLASLGRSGDNRYARAAEAQRAQLRKAQGQARRAGCNGGFSFAPANAAHCKALGNTISRMERNLRSLEQRGGGGSDGRNTGRERTRILASLDANGCRGGGIASRPQVQSVARDGGSLFDRLFGGQVERRPQAPEERGFPRMRATIGTEEGSIRFAPGLSGSFRTLCVRTCDGYFFPISYSSSGADLDRDQAACSAMCPGTEVELYFHRVPEEESEAMVSRAGTPYTALPTAFRYREIGFKRPPQCGCGPAKAFTVIAGEHDEAKPVEEDLQLLPSPRPDPAADPETLDNADGGLDAAAIARILAPKVPLPETADAGDADRKVRVVGPVFLPDPEAAIDLRSPARTELR